MARNISIPPGRIESSILSIRGQNVLLDSQLAELYEVETRALVQAVKRNLERFPDDFMFQLTKEELENWRSQIVMSNPEAKMGLRRQPYAFTEQLEYSGCYAWLGLWAAKDGRRPLHGQRPLVGVCVEVRSKKPFPGSPTGSC